MIVPASRPGPMGLIVAAPASGQGKTTVTLGLLRALARRGTRVAPAKIGPDFIDPGFHAYAAGRPSFNLDDWAMRDATLAGAVAAAGEAADLVICEGVMGLFDGAPGGGGSTADIAVRTGWPVLLVVDVAAQGQSVAALVHGFATWNPRVALAGCLLNRVGGDGHRKLAAEALAPTNIPVLGGLTSRADIGLPERHLGLVQARETAALDDLLDRLADHVEAAIDLDAVAALAGPAALDTTAATAVAPAIPPPGQRIALADDPAFAFFYPHLQAAWRRAGAEIVPFSPLADQAPDSGADAIYLPGGYPELHAGRLAANDRFLSGLRNAAAGGAIVYGECGGYMMLGEGLIDSAGVRHAMAGLLPVATSFAEPGLTIGYRRAVLAADGPLGRADTAFTAHEFHHSRQVDDGAAPPLFTATDDRGAGARPVGARVGTVSGSYLHLIDRVDD